MNQKIKVKMKDILPVGIIIDVDELPTENISESKLYRTPENKMYHNYNGEWLEVGSGGGIVNVESLPSTYVGTPVVCDGTPILDESENITGIEGGTVVENIYFNTSLTLQQVRDELSKVNFINLGNNVEKIYVIYYGIGRMIAALEYAHLLAIGDLFNEDSEVYFLYDGSKPTEDYFWTPLAEQPVFVNSASVGLVEGAPISVGADNHLISGMVSSEPFKPNDDLDTETIYRVVKAKYEGKPIPADSTTIIDNLYFNTELTKQEVISIVSSSNIQFTDTDFGDLGVAWFTLPNYDPLDTINSYIIAYTSTYNSLLISNAAYFEDIKNGTVTEGARLIFCSNPILDFNITLDGWNTDLEYPIPYNNVTFAEAITKPEYDYETLSQLVSIEPITKVNYSDSYWVFFDKWVRLDEPVIDNGFTIIDLEPKPDSYDLSITLPSEYYTVLENNNRVIINLKFKGGSKYGFRGVYYTFREDTNVIFYKVEGGSPSSHKDYCFFSFVDFIYSSGTPTMIFLRFEYTNFAPDIKYIRIYDGISNVSLKYSSKDDNISKSDYLELRYRYISNLYSDNSFTSSKVPIDQYADKGSQNLITSKGVYDYGQDLIKLPEVADNLVDLDRIPLNKYNGTPLTSDKIYNSGTIYLNINLTKDEVVEVLKELEYSTETVNGKTKNKSDLVEIRSGTNNLNLIYAEKLGDDAYTINSIFYYPDYDFDLDEVMFSNATQYGSGWSGAQWFSTSTGTYDIVGAGISPVVEVTPKAKEVSSLISLTEFVEINTKKIYRIGSELYTYDGEWHKIANKDAISETIVDVDELPSETINDKVIYRLKEVKTSWEGTKLPFDDTTIIENLYFNTNLTSEEVFKIINENVTLGQEKFGEYITAIGVDSVDAGDPINSYMLVNMDGQWAIGNLAMLLSVSTGEMIEGAILLYSSTEAPEFGVNFKGWNPNVTFPIAYGLPRYTLNSAENTIVDLADPLKELISTTPFVKKEDITYTYHAYNGKEYDRLDGGEEDNTSSEVVIIKEIESISDDITITSEEYNLMRDNTNVRFVVKQENENGYADMIFVKSTTLDAVDYAQLIILVCNESFLANTASIQFKPDTLTSKIQHWNYVENITSFMVTESGSGTGEKALRLDVKIGGSSQYWEIPCDDEPTKDSDWLITSGAVYKAIGDINALLDKLNGEEV